MNKSKFSDLEIKKLLTNKNVTRCSDRAISYNKDFKIKAVKQYYEEGLSASQIFSNAGFDLNIIRRDLPNECLGRWRKTFKMNGDAGFMTETRGKGGGRKSNKVTGLDRIRWLEAENAYLKAENSFLAKLRAKRKE